MDKQFYSQQLDQLKRIQKDSHHALRIAMCGKFKSGKSSLLNLMLGTNLPVKSITATGIVTKVIYGRMSAVKLKDGSVKNISEQELYDYITVANKDLDGVTLGEAEYAYVGSRSKLLKRGKVEFWDTPGLEDDTVLTAITMNAIQKCDFLIYVMHANQVLSQYEKRMFPKLCKLLNGNMIFVINHMDSLRDEEAQSVMSMVKTMLAGYTNSRFPNGCIFFTSANPTTPTLSSLTDAINYAVASGESRIDLLNRAQAGKAAVAAERWQEVASEDVENIKDAVRQYQQHIREDVNEKQSRLEHTHGHCTTTFQRLQNQTEQAILDESAWRMVLLDYQKVADWEKNFVNGAALCIKGRMKQLIQTANNGMKEAVQGTAFDDIFTPIVLDETRLWKRAHWYKNFSRPLLFPESRFKKYRTECVDQTIVPLMKHQVPQAKEIVSTYYSQIYKLIENRYHQALSNIKGEPELLQGLAESLADEDLLADYQKQILLIQADINSASRRNRFWYRVRELFSFFFPSMLRTEIFNDDTAAHIMLG